MKLRWKILIAIILAILFSMLIDGQTFVEPRLGKAQYDAFNDEYFSGKLPSDVIIKYTEKSTAIAATRFIGGRYEINFNPQFIDAEPIARIILLHEMCHIETWSEEMQHGRRWATCMTRLDISGAFRYELIRYFQIDDSLKRQISPAKE